MYERADLFRRKAEKLHRLDALDALVHQRRAVYRYLRPHPPDGVVQRFGRRDLLHLFRRAAAERAARRREPYARDLGVFRVAQALPYGAVLAVYRAQLAAALHERHDPRAADHYAFFICERYVYSAFERRLQRLYRRDARRREDRVVHARVEDDLRQRRLAAHTDEALLAPRRAVRLG